MSHSSHMLIFMHRVAYSSSRCANARRDFKRYATSSCVLFAATSYFIPYAFDVCRWKSTHLVPTWHEVLCKYAVCSAEKQIGLL